MRATRYARTGTVAAAVILALALAPSAGAASWLALMVGDSTSSNSVTPITVPGDSAGAMIGAGNNPFGIAVSPDGSTAYVADFNTNNGGADGVTAIDLAQSPPSTSFIQTDPVGGTFKPLNVAVSPDGNTLWAVYPGAGELEKVDLTTTPATVGAPFSDGTSDGADSIALSPDGRTAYVTDQPENQVSVLDLTQNPPTRVATVSLGSNANPFGIGVSPDGSKVFVADINSSALSVIDTATRQATNVSLPDGAYGVAVAPDGRTVWVTGGQDVQPVDVSGATPTVGTPIHVTFPDDTANGVAQGIAISPDGEHLYVGDGYFGSAQGPFGDQTIDVPIPSGTPQTAIDSGDTLRAGVVTPDQAPVADFTVTPGQPGTPTQFDASSSTVAVGSIATYNWNFGDGTGTTTTGPTVSHTYGAAGAYTATVTETDTAGTSTTQIYTGQSVLRNGGPGAQAAKTVVIGAGPQPTAALNASSLRYGTVGVGSTSAAQTVTVTNTGQAPLRVSGVGVTGADRNDFLLGSDGCTGATLAAGSACSVSVSFRPAGGSLRTATLAFTDNASGSPQVVQLSGIGSLAATLGGSVLDGSNGGAPVAGAAVQICLQHTLSPAFCHYATTGSNGAYSFANLSPGAWAMQVQPTTSRLFSGSALVQIVPGNQTQDFTLQPPAPLPAGFSVTTPTGVVSQGVPVVTWNQPFSFQVPVGYPTHGTPNTVQPMAVVAGVGDTGGGFERGTIAMYSAYFGPNGQVERFSPVVMAQMDCAGTGAAACSALSADVQGNPVGVAGDHTSRDQVRAAAGSNCVGPGWQLTPNGGGGVTFTFTDANGQQWPIPLEQLAIPHVSTGDPFADAVSNLSADVVNTAISINPVAGWYNVAVGALNAAANQPGSTPAQLWTAAGKVSMNVLAQTLNMETHGAFNFWFGNLAAAGFGGLNVGPPRPANGVKPPCGPNRGAPGYADPSGLVETTTGVPLAHARVVLTRSNRRHGRQQQVPAGSRTMSPANRRNPDHTTLLGTFGWDVLPGFYQVKASYPGCRAARRASPFAVTSVLEIPPPVDNLILRLRCPAIRRAGTRLRLTVHATSQPVPELALKAVVRSLARRGPAAGRHSLIGTVTFRLRGRILGTALVDPRTGVAILDVTVRSLAHLAVSATFAGNGRLAPSTASQRG